MADYSFEEQKKITKEMSDKIYNDSYTTTEEELVKDVNWIQASKDVYKQLEGVEWSGSDEDAAKKGLDMMGRFNYNLTLGTINYTTQLQDAPDQTKLSFYYLMDMYDKKDISGNGVLRAFKEMGLDPASYIGIGTLGAGFVGKQAAAQTAKAGVKEMLKRGAIKYLQSTTAVAATEGAIYTAADDIARQEAAIGAGVQDEYSPGQTAVAAGVGGAVGAGFVQGAKAVGKGINKVIQEGEEVMARAAGGGTPPKIDKTFEGYSYSAPDEIKDLFHSGNLDQINPDKILWTTGNKDYALKFGKKDTKQLYQIEKENLNILDGYSDEGKKILEEANKQASKPMREVFNPDGGVSSFVIQDDKVIQYLRDKGYDAVRTSESYASTNPAVGIINPNKVKINPIKGAK